MRKFKNKKTIIIGAIVLVLLISGLGVFFIFNITPDIENIKDSVVMIETFDGEGNSIGTGSGFCAYKDNYIVTNFHVIQGAKKIKIIDDNKKEYDINKIEIIKSGDDLAILSGNFSFKPIQIANNKLKAGDSVTAIGSPKGQLNTVSTGVVSNADDDYEIRITAPISPGSSGGVLLNNKNQVIGITYAAYNSIEAQNINYAINVSYLEEMYNNLIGGDCFNLPDSQFSDLDNFYKFETLDIYYYVDSLDTFYNATSIKKKFENLLKEKSPEWFDIFDTLSSEQKYECVSILEDFKSIDEIELALKKVKDYSIEEIAYDVAVKKYQYAIILEKASTLENANDIIYMIDSLPVKDGQKTLLKYCFVYKNISYFSDEENRALTNYLFQDKYNSGYNSGTAVSVLEKMGYRVEKNGNTYTTYWD